MLPQGLFPSLCQKDLPAYSAPTGCCTMCKKPCWNSTKIKLDGRVRRVCQDCFVKHLETINGPAQNKSETHTEPPGENYALRLARFDKLCARIKHKRIADFIAIHELNVEDKVDLDRCALEYLSRVVRTPIFWVDEDDDQTLFFLLSKAPNITPTGMILPKNYSCLEYNILMRRFYEAMNNTGLINESDMWQIPMHIRVKFPTANQEDIDSRPRHAPEEPHLDSWSGYSTCGITVVVPLMGDTEHNTIKFWKLARPLFDEHFLYPTNGNKGLEHGIAAHYVPIEYTPSYREIFIYDAAALHATKRMPGCGGRISIDNIFVPDHEGIEEHIGEWRKKEQMSHGQLLEIGCDHVFEFPDNDWNKNDTVGGAKDPINYKIVDFRT